MKAIGVVIGWRKTRREYGRWWEMGSGVWEILFRDLHPSNITVEQLHPVLDPGAWRINVPSVTIQLNSTPRMKGKPNTCASAFRHAAELFGVNEDAFR
jgi:hypothetical protein